MGTKKPQSPASKGKANKKSTGAASSKKAPSEDIISDGKVVLTVDIPLSDTELVEQANLMISKIEIRDTLKADLKAKTTELKGQIAGIDQAIKTIETLITSRKKKEAVPVLKVKNFKTTKVMFLKLDTDLKNIKPEDIYKEEPFSALDYQTSIEMESEGEDSEDDDIFKTLPAVHNTEEEAEIVD